MGDSNKKKYEVVDVILSVLTPENIQTYFLGTKKNGKPRSVYDIVKQKKKPGKKKGKNKEPDMYSLYIKTKKNDNKKKKKKGKKNKKKYSGYYY